MFIKKLMDNLNPNELRHPLTGFKIFHEFSGYLFLSPFCALVFLSIRLSMSNFLGASVEWQILCKREHHTFHYQPTSELCSMSTSCRSRIRTRTPI